MKLNPKISEIYFQIFTKMHLYLLPCSAYPMWHLKEVVGEIEGCYWPIFSGNTHGKNMPCNKSKENHIFPLFFPHFHSFLPSLSPSHFWPKVFSKENQENQREIEGKSKKNWREERRTKKVSIFNHLIFLFKGFD